MDIRDIIDVDALPEWAQSALLPAAQPDWPDADPVANEARINMLNAGMPGGLQGDILRRRPQPPLGRDSSVSLFFGHAVGAAGAAY